VYEKMEDGRRIIRRCLLVLVLAAAAAGLCYYYGNNGQYQHQDTGGTLVEQMPGGTRYGC
jgi:hypothetical protein